MKIQVIINPSSGLQNVGEDIDYICDELLKHHAVTVEYTQKQHDAKNLTLKAVDDNVDLLIVSGGDGTLNEVVNGLGQLDKGPALAIYPGGTTNDFATYLKIEKNPDNFIKLINDFHIEKFDLGKMNDNYFINVCAIGKIASVANDTDVKMKAMLGKLAYILEAIYKLPQMFDEIPRLEISTKTTKYKLDCLLLIISNTSTVGGYKNLCPKAETNDGLFDVLAIKNMAFNDFADLYLKILSGTHIDDDKIHYFQTDYLEVSSSDKNLDISLDGEKLGKLPLIFETLKRKVNVLTRKE